MSTYARIDAQQRESFLVSLQSTSHFQGCPVRSHLYFNNACKIRWTCKSRVRPSHVSTTRERLKLFVWPLSQAEKQHAQPKRNLRYQREPVTQMCTHTATCCLDANDQPTCTITKCERVLISCCRSPPVTKDTDSGHGPHYRGLEDTAHTSVDSTPT